MAVKVTLVVLQHFKGTIVSQPGRGGGLVTGHRRSGYG